MLDLIGANMRKQFNPFPAVSGAYGAPMGRHGDNPANLQDVKRLHCKHQGGNGGYDRGGAYWGNPCNVFAVWGRIDGEIVCCYVRANNRLEAIAKIRNGAE